MKSLVLILSLFFILPQSANASRARNLVLGTGDAGFILGALGDSGSFSSDDVYNIFYNPSYAASNRDWAIIEKYDGVAGVGSAVNGAAGGFMTSFASFTFGFYFNRAGAVDSTHFTGAATGAANYRPFDFILAGETGIKWGLGLSYGSSDTGATDNDDLTVRLGFVFGSFDPFVHYQISGNNSTGASTDLFVGGLRYHWGEWNPVIAYRQHRTSSSTDSRRWGIGVSRFSESSEGVTYGFSVGYWRDTSAGITSVPFEIMIEGKAASWLTLRAGLVYPAVSRQGGVSLADTTTGRVGATLTFGALEFDWAIGSGDNSSAIGAAQTGTGPIDNPTFGFDDSLFSAASLKYKW